MASDADDTSLLDWRVGVIWSAGVDRAGASSFTLPSVGRAAAKSRCTGDGARDTAADVLDIASVWLASVGQLAGRAGGLLDSAMGRRSMAAVSAVSLLVECTQATVGEGSVASADIEGDMVDMRR